MEIKCQQVGKHFNYQWVFRKLKYTFQTGKRYLIKGPNGSGKTTLLRIVAGQLSPSQGIVTYHNSTGEKLSPDQYYRYISYAAPYLELIEQFTLRESIRFHQRFQPFRDGMTKQEWLKKTELQASANKPLKYFSSGMLQRTRLGLALYSKVPFILLDEPLTNLDATAQEWYKKQVTELKSEKKALIICSNQPAEHAYCEKELTLTDYQ
jgi:ABC-type multidrug transport system ATPase subunit